MRRRVSRVQPGPKGHPTRVTAAARSGGVRATAAEAKLSGWGPVARTDTRAASSPPRGRPE
eukprot:8598237-Alexandrium_andersonii.AAC.1